MTNRLPPNLYGVLATEAPVAVILRRGPTRMVRLIKWDTERDTFENGQWFKGRIYEVLCDLSPDGSKFAYFATKYNRRTLARADDVGFAWTALSRPPYLTALALWPSNNSTWYGDAYFQGNWELELNLAPGCERGDATHPISKQLTVTVNNGLFHKRLNAHGWYESLDSTFWQRISPCGNYKLMMDMFMSHRRYWVQSAADYGSDALLVDGTCKSMFRLTKPDSPWGWKLQLVGCTWADWDQHGRFVFATAGKLFAGELHNGQISVKNEIADFNEMTFENIPAPKWALGWETIPPKRK